MVRNTPRLHRKGAHGGWFYLCAALMGREDMSSLPFTTMCIRESLRLHSPVQAVTRRYLQDVKLPGGHTVPKGKHCFICVMAKLAFSIITVRKCWLSFQVCCFGFGVQGVTFTSCTFISRLGGGLVK